MAWHMFPVSKHQYTLKLAGVSDGTQMLFVMLVLDP